MNRIFTSALAVLAISLVAVPPAHAQTAATTFLLGSAASPDSAARTITLTAESRWINVMNGESVRFVSGTNEFAWKFDGPGGRSFDLRQVAPAGALSQPITVYIAAVPGHR